MLKSHFSKNTVEKVKMSSKSSNMKFEHFSIQDLLELNFACWVDISRYLQNCLFTY